jgi:hypothetical protein
MAILVDIDQPRIRQNPKTLPQGVTPPHCLRQASAGQAENISSKFVIAVPVCLCACVPVD